MNDFVELDKLKEYNERTIENGIVMPRLEDFDRKMQMAIDLWPQINKNGGIDYLLGKGVGVEVALRGTVQNRKKYHNNFPYRSHSDFEIYDTLGYNEIPESDKFRYVFGAMEIYPKSKTKGLSGMEEDLMDRTYEIVEYNGRKYLVPQLEILFLDKYLRKESTPRKEGYDAELLMMEYDLDIEKIKDYYIKYVKTTEMNDFLNRLQGAYERQIIGLTEKMVTMISNKLEEEGIDISFDNIIKGVNHGIKKWKSTSVSIVCGVRLDICPDDLKFIEKNGKIDLDETTKQEILRLIEKVKVDKEKEYDDELNSIVEMYLKIQKGKAQKENNLKRQNDDEIEL